MHHSDHAVLNDKLDRYNAVQNMAKEIYNCDKPQTFGLHGDWGAGKTSFLRQLRQRLDGSKDGCYDDPIEEIALYDKEIVTVWFDAWRYQYEQSPIVALLQEIRRQFGTWAKIKKKGQKLKDVAVTATLNSLNDIAKLIGLESLPVSPNTIKKSWEDWNKEHLETKLGVDTITEYLEKAVESLLKAFVKKKTRKLVIFIDDLDRCTPESAFRLLESLKIYMNINRCVFVIGMNQQLVVESIAKYMPSEFCPDNVGDKKSYSELRAEAYLEKICSSITRLIPPEKPTNVISEWIDEDIKSLFRESVKIDVIGHNCLPPNPRKLKALANLINKWKHHIEDDSKDDMRSLVIISYLYQFHSELFQRLQFSPNFYLLMEKWVNGDLKKQQDEYMFNPSNIPIPEDIKIPPYFRALTTPSIKVTSGVSEAVPTSTLKSTFPDPYAPNVFWIAPLIQKDLINQGDLIRLLRKVLA